MKVGKRLRLLCLLAALAPLLSVGSVTAIEATDLTQTVTQTTTNAQTKTSTLLDRLETRKTALATKLSTAQTARLKARCQAAQAKLNTVNERAQTIVSSRVTAYRNLYTGLSELATKLDGEVNTTDLQAALKTLNDKTDGFETDGNTYKQSLADLLAMDCASDPTAFRASLDSAKAEQTKLADDAAAIRTHVQETIKPVLQAIRASLAQGSSN
jgi:hypothetical protein